MDGYIDGWMHGWMDGCMDRYMDGWMDDLCPMKALPTGQESPARGSACCTLARDDVLSSFEGLRCVGKGWSQAKGQARCPAPGRSCIDRGVEAKSIFFSILPIFLASIGWIWGPRGASSGGDDPEQTIPTQVSAWCQAALQRHEFHAGGRTPCRRGDGGC